MGKAPVGTQPGAAYPLTGPCMEAPARRRCPEPQPAVVACGPRVRFACSMSPYPGAASRRPVRGHEPVRTHEQTHSICARRPARRSHGRAGRDPRRARALHVAERADRDTAPRRDDADDCDEYLVPRRQQPRDARVAPASRTCSSTSCSRAPRTCRKAGSTSGSRRWAARRTARHHAIARTTCRVLAQCAGPGAVHRERPHGAPAARHVAGEVDGQRDVVKNERRQSYDNRPYGLASQLLTEALYPSSHPYSWPVIGYMDHLAAPATTMSCTSSAVLHAEQCEPGHRRRH
jgi:hypothetical protein